MKRTLATLGVVSALVFGLATTVPAATAATKHPTYALGKARKCRPDYVKRTERHKVKGKERRYVACVYMAPKPAHVTPATTPATTTTVPSTTTPTPTITYSAHLDPTFSQSPSNPLAVTYIYTADATETSGGVTTDLGLTGQLPGGILDLFSNGLLKCSINVGGDVTGGDCPVTYNAFGPETIVTDYIAQDANTSETDQEDIEQFPTYVALGTVNDTGTVDYENYAYTELTIPVTVSGLTGALGTTGTISLTNGVGPNCGSLTYNASQGTATGSCNVSLEDSAGASSFSPIVTFSGDTNYSSSGVTGSGTTIPAAPSPTPANVSTSIVCTNTGLSNFCTDFNSSTDTVTAKASVTAGDGSIISVGTVSFVDANSVPICTASVINGTASCSESIGTAPPGLITATYSGGGPVEIGDTIENTYESSVDSTGHSN